MKIKLNNINDGYKVYNTVGNRIRCEVPRAALGFLQARFHDGVEFAIQFPIRYEIQAKIHENQYGSRV